MIRGSFAAAHENHRNNRLLWMPMIRVSLSDAVNVNAQHIVEYDVSALIDTAADYCVIDRDMIDRHKTFVGRGTGFSLGPTGFSTNEFYSVQVVLNNEVNNVALQMSCPAADLRRTGYLVDLILGMDALRFFELSLLPREGRVTMSWIET